MTFHRMRSCVLLLLTAACVLFIFSNSMQPATESHGMSTIIAAVVDRFLRTAGLRWTITDFAMRKTAHFIEYSLLGILLYASVRSFGKSLKDSVFMQLFLLLAVPVTDEWIQLFSPGRTSLITDVLLDFSGGVSGIVLSLIILVLIRLHSKKKVMI